VVVLRLRGRTTLGATFIKDVTDYAGRLADADGRLYLSGLQPDLTERLRRTGSVEGPLRAVEATPVVGESTHTAYLDAEAWSPRPGRARGWLISCPDGPVPRRSLTLRRVPGG
jgi:SulP family sulfate permease